MRFSMRQTSALCTFMILASTFAAAPAWGQSDPPQAASAPAEKSLTSEELVAMAREVQDQVAELRGWKFKHPVKTDVYSEEQLRAFIEKMVFDQQYGDGRLERTEAFLRIVGLVPADCDLRKTIVDVLLNQVGGFYDHETKSFYMLRRDGVGYGPLLTRTLIAHELTHALDDQYADLGKLVTAEFSEDGMAAAASVIEGSATVLMVRYMLREMQTGKYDPDELMRVQQQEMERSEAFLKAPPYFSTLLANYMCGMWFVSRGSPPTGIVPGQDRSVGEDVLAALRNPPASTEQILHPEKYWNENRRDEPVLIDEDAVEHLLQTSDRQIVHRDTVGELLCSLLTSDEHREVDLVLAGQPGYWTNEAATGWGGDRFFLTAAGSDADAAKKDLKAVWFTMWDTPDDRTEFMDDYSIERDMPNRTVIKLGRRCAVYFFGYDEAERNAIAERLEQSPPAFSKSGKSWKP